MWPISNIAIGFVCFFILTNLDKSSHIQQKSLI